MNANETIDNLFNQYVDLKRILSADDPKQEAQAQLDIVKAKMQAMGIVTTDLEF